MQSTITVIGNLVEDPTLRHTDSGTPVLSIRVAINERYQDKSGEWKDGTPVFVTVTTWRQLAANTAETVRKGDQVLVAGRLRQRSYETDSGEKRSVLEVEADAIGPSLAYATATLTKTTRPQRDEPTPA
jgi:single-strand DNA-binding protein